LIVDDLAPYVGADVVYKVLLRRGVFKWLAVRRHLIRYKNCWRHESTQMQKRIRETKRDIHAVRGELDKVREDGDTWMMQFAEWRLRYKQRELAYTRGYLAALEKMRAEVDDLCHYPRWTVQDNDRRALKWLMEQEETWTPGRPM
jgi:hypothetical protein